LLLGYLPNSDVTLKQHYFIGLSFNSEMAVGMGSAFYAVIVGTIREHFM